MLTLSTVIIVHIYSAFIKVDRDNGNCEYYDAADENLCNWMMFIRPASTFAEQNLVAYQFRNEIYFSTMCNIQTGQELKV